MRAARLLRVAAFPLCALLASPALAAEFQRPIHLAALVAPRPLLTPPALLAPLFLEVRAYPATAGVGVGAANTWTGTQTFRDNAFVITDDSDTTKVLNFQLSGITTGTTRTYTWPNSNGTIPLIAAAQAWSGANTYSASIRMNNDAELFVGTNQINGFQFDTTNVPDTLRAYVGNTSNSFGLVEDEDRNSNFGNGACGTSICSTPTMNIHSSTIESANYNSRAFYGTAGKFVVTLTESSATNILQIPVADNTSVAGVFWVKVFASDGTDHQARFATLRYVAVNEGGTETCTIAAPSGATATAETDDENAAQITLGTLTYAWACTAGTNAVDITLNAVSSLTQTVFTAEGQLGHVGAGEPLPF